MASATKINYNRNGAQCSYILYHKILHFGIQLSQTCIFHLLSSPQSATKMERPQCNLWVESPIGKAAAQPWRVPWPSLRSVPEAPSSPVQQWRSCYHVYELRREAISCLV